MGETQDRTCAPLVGAHMSIAGGVWRAFGRAEDAGANCLQVFVKSNVQWRVAALDSADLEKFESERRRTRIAPVVAHACYLVNPASPDSKLFRKSLADIIAEITRCEEYRIEWLVLHPGNHLGSGGETGARTAADFLSRALGATRRAGVLIETTSGAGTAVGAVFEEIAEMIRLAGGGDRLGVCLDTAHVFAAGYDIKSEKGYAAAKRRLAELGLLERIKVIHANDSKAPLGSHIDRHTHIGKGHIGREGFRRLMRDEDFAEVPKILETPKGLCGRRDCDRSNIALLRRLASG